MKPRDRRRANQEARAARRHKKLADKPAAPPGATKLKRMDFTCDTHGKRPWNGTLVCAKCFHVFQMADDKAPLFAPEVCVCGARLRPAVSEAERISAAELNDTYSYRAICGVCYDIALAGDGRFVAPDATGTPR